MKKPKLYIILGLFLFLTWNCNAHLAQAPMEFETIVYNQYGPEMQSTEKWIDNQEEFEKTFQEMHRNLMPSKEIPNIDFDEKAVVLLHFGRFSYGGIHYEVVDVENVENTLNIKLSRSGPKAGEPALMVITNPFMFIEVSKMKSAPEQINLTLIENN